MSAVLSAVARHAAAAPERIALENAGISLSYAALEDEIRRCARRISGRGTLALVIDNSPAWAVLDLAALAAGVAAVPIPGFFSLAQQLHALKDAGATCIATDTPQAVLDLLARGGVGATPIETLELAGSQVSLLRIAGAAGLPSGTAKITYTSGTTGAPKGVCLSAATLQRVAASLAEVCALSPADRHLSVLPLSTLLENVGGVYAPLLAGATCCLPRLSEVGLSGAAGLDAQRLIAALARFEASTAILVPQMLQALVARLEAGEAKPARLRLIAVGGARVSSRWLARAAGLGLPVYEGYGLSECGSVVALNAPGAARPGSVGRPLPHVAIEIAPDGEILVRGASLLGYAGRLQAVREPIATGDLGYLDPDGYLHIAGRKKNLFITAFGRNVAPEWVESELGADPAIAQAAVFGEARPWNVAVIVARGAPAAVDRAVAAANGTLPDYARIRRWIAADAPFTPQSGELTLNGRIRRDAVWARYRDRIQRLYEERA